MVLLRNRGFRLQLSPRAAMSGPKDTSPDCLPISHHSEEFSRSLDTMSPSAIRAANQSPHDFFCPFITGIRGMVANEILKSERTLHAFSKPSDYNQESLQEAIADIEAEDVILAANVTSLDKYQSTNDSACTAGMQAALRDLKALQMEVKDRKERAQVLWNRLVSTLALTESRQSIEQSNSTKQLTQLAYVFLPLSLSTSVFGMNTTELQDTRLWMFFATASILLMMSVVLWFVFGWISAPDTYNNILGIGISYLVLLKFVLIAPTHAITMILFALCHTTIKTRLTLIHIGVWERLWNKEEPQPTGIDLHRFLGQESQWERYWLQKVLEVQSLAAIPRWHEKYFWQRSRRRESTA